MKTKHWVLLLSAVALLCGVLTLWLLRPTQPAAQIEILSDNQLLYTLSLSEDQEITVATQWGSNTVTVKDGKVAVTQADCPDGYCTKRGWCQNGTPIVCLPHRLQIRFTAEQQLDGITG